ncbi:MAG: glycosyltransferase [Flavobacterium sp.]|nr:glycosyltransferase [Flavobacterium sp.]
MPEILFITSYPPRQCGIATYSQDLIKALEKQFIHSFQLKICALESDAELHLYDDEAVKYTLNASQAESFATIASKINADDNISTVVLQHEFGFFAENFEAFHQFVTQIEKPLVVVFHTVLPDPQENIKKSVQHMLDNADGVIVMTKTAADVLTNSYHINSDVKIEVIPHGTHLVPYLDKEVLKEKYGYENRKILSTFGLLNSGKSIETTLDALPSIVKTCPEALFLIIGKTHPTVAYREGEKYRDMLTSKIEQLHLTKHVKFINKYLPLEELLEYLQMTDIYLFTSKDPHQAVSGTFSYALSCACPIVSTPIPHATEVLSEGAGLIFDFGNSEQLADCVNRILFDVKLRNDMIMNGMHKIICTSWQNAAVAHAKFFQKLSDDGLRLRYRNPAINMDHIKKMTTDFGILQFSKINCPDVTSGYTLDDNARALIAFCQHYKLTQDASDLKFIKKYIDFIAYCECSDGKFMNYVDYYNNFTLQNTEVNLEDSTGRAIWALGYVISLSYILPDDIVDKAEQIFERSLRYADNFHSPRAMAFIIKGIYYYNRAIESRATLNLAETFANRLVQMYRHEATEDWLWFEDKLTYANSVLPEALLCTYALTGNVQFKNIAKESFDFLLSKTFTDQAIKVVSNKSWHPKDQQPSRFGEQPIDVAYTIIALRKFHDVFKEKEYLEKMEIAFNWFLGNNHLQQVVYNPCTGGCFDGLEETHVNLNQGAESSISYLMARLMSYKFFSDEKDPYQRRRIKSATQVS